VLAAGVFVFVLATTFTSKRHTIQDAFPDSGRPQVATGRAAEAANILLVGSDVDKPSTEPEQQLAGKPQADTIMLLHVPADRSAVYAMSILRKSLVDVPGHGRQPVNAAYAFGGSKLTVQTVENLLGVRIDHVVNVSIPGLKGLTNALGGVTIRNRTAYHSGTYTFPAGKQKLNGDQVLQYMTGGSDPQQADAQESYFRGVFDDILSAKTLLNPATVSTVVSVISPYLSVDEGFEPTYIAGLGFSLRGLHSSDIRTFRLPTRGVTQFHGVPMLELDPAGVADVGSHLKSDTLDAIAG
jgi:LCP family protein required for cell wall assembly